MARWECKTELRKEFIPIIWEYVSRITRRDMYTDYQAAVYTVPNIPAPYTYSYTPYLKDRQGVSVCD